MDTKQRVTITLSPETLARVDRLASLRDISRSKMMESLMDLAIEDVESTMDKIASPVIGPIVQSIMDHPKLIGMLAAAIGDRMKPAELAEWEEMAPKLRATRGRLRDERGRRRDLESEDAK